MLSKHKKEKLPIKTLLVLYREVYYFSFTNYRKIILCPKKVNLFNYFRIFSNTINTKKKKNTTQLLNKKIFYLTRKFL